MILQITNDFSGSKVYKNLFSELDKLGVEQIVYTAMRKGKKTGGNAIVFECPNSKIVYSSILTKFSDRLLYKKKIDKIYNDLISKVDMSKVTFIHAHTWYSDGGVALKLHKEYNIPFSVAIRNTDVNIFYKYFIHERKFGKKILNKATNIFFISKVYEEKVLDKLPSKNKLADKVQVIPNGVEVFWIKNAVMRTTPKVLSSKVDLIYVGKLTSNKNILSLMEAIVLLNQKQGRTYYLNIIGQGGNKEKEVLSKLDEYKELNFFSYHGGVNDKDRLKELYQNSDIFVLPSKPETFGLVYIEAMLMGLPIIYTKGEGIDSFYSENIGEKVNNISVEEIGQVIANTIENYESYQIPINDIIYNHDWSKIAEKYRNLYLV